MLIAIFQCIKRNSNGKIANKKSACDIPLFFKGSMIVSDRFYSDFAL